MKTMKEFSTCNACRYHYICCAEPSNYCYIEVEKPIKDEESLKKEYVKLVQLQNRSGLSDSRKNSLNAKAGLVRHELWNIQYNKGGRIVNIPAVKKEEEKVKDEYTLFEAIAAIMADEQKVFITEFGVQMYSDGYSVMLRNAEVDENMPIPLNNEWGAKIWKPATIRRNYSVRIYVIDKGETGSLVDSISIPMNIMELQQLKAGLQVERNVNRKKEEDKNGNAN